MDLALVGIGLVTLLAARRLKFLKIVGLALVAIGGLWFLIGFLSSFIPAFQEAFIESFLKAAARR